MNDINIKNYVMLNNKNNYNKVYIHKRIIKKRLTIILYNYYFNKI